MTWVNRIAAFFGYVKAPARGETALLVQADIRRQQSFVHLHYLLKHLPYQLNFETAEEAEFCSGVLSRLNELMTSEARTSSDCVRCFPGRAILRARLLEWFLRWDAETAQAKTEDCMGRVDLGDFEAALQLVRAIFGANYERFELRSRQHRAKLPLIRIAKARAAEGTPDLFVQEALEAFGETENFIRSLLSASVFEATRTDANQHALRG